MATWEEFAGSEPEMAELGQRILAKYGIAYIGTIRPDGSPRVHPISPIIVAGGLYIGLMPKTPKRRDLDRDNRCTLHGLPGPNDSEISIIGRARQLAAEEVEALIAQAPPNVRIARDTFLYELDIEQVNYTMFEHSPVTGGRPVPARTRWIPGVR
jgi:hypothetical protein